MRRAGLDPPPRANTPRPRAMAGQGPPCGLDDDPDDGGRGRPGHSGRGAMTDTFSSEGSKATPKPFTVEEGRRRVRSFVLRQGRLTPAQQRAFDAQWPRLGLALPGPTGA